MSKILCVSFAKVAEYQQHGLVHYHAVIRFDGPEGSTTPPLACATADILIQAVQKATDRVALTLESDAVGVRKFGWGKQIDVREIISFGRETDLTDQAVVGYVAKYATKGAEDSGTVDHPVFCTTCQGRGHRGRADCPTCGGTGEGIPLRSPVAARHVRQMIRIGFELGRLAEFAHLKLWKWAHMLGFRGHFSTKSRRYSTTLVTESSWAFRGTGYTPGEELLAAQVRHERAWARQLKAEGGDHA